MKSSYVADLQADQPVTSFFLVCEKEIRTGSTGRSYLRLELGDRTGTIEAKMWEKFEDLVATFDRDDFVKVQGRIEAYRGKPQIIVDRIRPAPDTEVDLADFFPHTAEDVDALHAELRRHVSGMSNPWLRRLLESILDDPDLSARLKRAPAAKTMHHAWLGGLIEHIAGLCRLCTLVAGHYPETDLDLLLTGAILHDIGKTEELSYERSLGYTDPGQLLGHIVQGLAIVGRKIDAIAGFPSALRSLVEHLIISHHGRYEFGSPKLPAFREALMLHYLDDLDSKMAAIRASLASSVGEGYWTAFNQALQRRILRVDQFLKADASAAPQQLKLDAAAGSGRKD